MTTLIFGAVGLCAFLSFGAGLTSVIELANKDFKLGKNKREVVNDEIKSFREEVGRTHKIH
ncbi:MAG: hypothetical protein IRZ03_19050 [Acidobacterium ailaaui]|jgi:hypothetical protein|nr:hypothetical protein [Pseudacidobacterium ailaaui]